MTQVAFSAACFNARVGFGWFETEQWLERGEPQKWLIMVSMPVWALGGLRPLFVGDGRRCGTAAISFNARVGFGWFETSIALGLRLGGFLFQCPCGLWVV